jgi:hypothetical protein
MCVSGPWANVAGDNGGLAAVAAAGGRLKRGSSIRYVCRMWLASRLLFSGGPTRVGVICSKTQGKPLGVVA